LQGIDFRDDDLLGSTDVNGASSFRKKLEPKDSGNSSFSVCRG
jgi:hypothetical protein